MENILAKHEVIIGQLVEQVKENRESTKAIHGMTIELGNLSKSLDKYAAKSIESAKEQGQRLGVVESDVNLIKSKNYDSRLAALEGAGKKYMGYFISGLLGALGVGIVSFILTQLGHNPYVY